MATARVIIGKTPRVKINISKRFTSAQRVAIARDVIAFIIERTRDGKGKDGKAFAGYSKEYIKSKDFARGEKSPGEVDLTLSGEMLNSMELKTQSSGSITVGVAEDQAGKAEGNILGTYGKSTPKKSKARNFLELSTKELSAILSSYTFGAGGSNTARRAQQESDEATEIAGDIVGGLFE